MDRYVLVRARSTLLLFCALFCVHCTRDFNAFLRGDADSNATSSYEVPVTLDGCNENAVANRPTRLRFAVAPTAFGGSIGCIRTGAGLTNLAPNALISQVEQGHVLRFAVALGDATDGTLHVVSSGQECGSDRYGSRINNLPVHFTRGGKYLFTLHSTIDDGQEGTVVREADCVPRTAPWVRVINNTGFPLTANFTSGDGELNIPASREVISPGASFTAARANRGYVLAEGNTNWRLSVAVPGTSITKVSVVYSLQLQRYSWFVERNENELQIWPCIEVDGSAGEGTIECLGQAAE